MTGAALKSRRRVVCRLLEAAERQRFRLPGKRVLRWCWEEATSKPVAARSSGAADEALLRMQAADAVHSFPCACSYWEVARRVNDVDVDMYLVQ